MLGVLYKYRGLCRATPRLVDNVMYNYARKIISQFNINNHFPSSTDVRVGLHVDALCQLSVDVLHNHMQKLTIWFLVFALIPGRSDNDDDRKMVSYAKLILRCVKGSCWLWGFARHVYFTSSVRPSIHVLVQHIGDSWTESDPEINQMYW